LAIPPKEYRDIYITKPRRGHNLLNINHNDSVLQKTRRGLVVRYKASSGERSKYLAKYLDVNLSKEGPFSYMGGGKLRKGTIRQFENIQSAQRLHWLRLRFENKLDRYLNLDHVSFLPLETKPEAVVDFDANISTALSNRQDLKDVRHLLYADIDLNIVDGSSVWLSSMASLLAAAGPTLLVAKRKIKVDIVTSNIRNAEKLHILSPDELGLGERPLTVTEAAQVLRHLDRELPCVERLVLRGLTAAYTLSGTRQFSGRTALYLTDFYQPVEAGWALRDGAKNMMT